MMIRLNEIPGDELHLLHSTDPRVYGRPRRRRRRVRSRAAVNRSIASLNEQVSELLPVEAFRRLKSA